MTRDPAIACPASAKVAWPMLALLALLAIAPRLAFGLIMPMSIGDSYVYLTVAENIYQNRCVSMSPPASGLCVPHWGGNQFPGYPFFIALAWWAFGGWYVAPLFAQSLCSAAAILRLVTGLTTLGVDRRSTTAAGIVLALSPVALPFARYYWTEALAIATTIWVFAEILICVAQQRLFSAWIVAALAAAIAIRIDGILLLAPTILVGCRYLEWRRGLLQLTVVAMLLAVPLGMWSWRSASQGLGWTPRLLADADKGTPDGFVRWTRSWMTNQYQLEAVNWEAIQLRYDSMRIPASAYASAEEKAKIEALIERLKSHLGQPMPKDIATEFKAIADLRIAANPLRYWVLLPMERAVWLWLNPFTALGWPGTVDPGSKAAIMAALGSGSIADTLRIASGDGGQLALRGFGLVYRALLLLTLAWVAADVARGRRFPGDTLVVLAGLYVMLRTGAFAFIGGVETRYIVEAVPAAEVAAALGLLARRQRS